MTTPPRASAVRVGLSKVAVLGVGVAPAAFATAAAGPVAFVAFVSAPVARRLLANGDPGLIVSGVFGALLLTSADLVARLAIGGIELPVGLITGTLGAPYLVWLLITSNRASELLAALALAGAEGWLAVLPEGLGTRVGSGGNPLSLVQAQQIALARLVLRGADIAVLDEATAEAGSSGAQELERSIGHVLAGRTALLVAHRLTTAAAADRAVVMEHGRVVEQGPPAELATGVGPYAALWEAWRAAR